MTDDENPRFSKFDCLKASGGASAKSDRMMADDIISEGLASLALLCERFEFEVQAGQTDDGIDNVQQVHDDLARIRNLLVVLDKLALAFVVEELMALCDPGRILDISASKLSASVLANAASRFCDTISLLKENRDFDSALTLIPVINDCRACLDRPYISDAFLLAIGIDLSATSAKEQKDNLWLEERQIWIRIASTGHASLRRCFTAWSSEDNTETARALIEQIQFFIDSVKPYNYLRVLSHLFQSAEATVTAIREKKIVKGPALELMFRQLEQHVSGYELIRAPADLVPRDLLRNFLYYVAQSESDSGPALQLRRNFRLERIRNLSTLGQPLRTPTIGVAYHLFNAIRSRITVQTRPLSEWLDSFQRKEQSVPSLTVTRVRLNQLEPILTMMGAAKALQHLQALNVYLLSKTLADDINTVMASRLAQLLLDLDTCLDQKARQTIAIRKQPEVELRSSDAIYMDMAVDVCLREACSDLHAISAQLFMQVNSGDFDAACAIEVNGRIALLNQVLQILPLPGINSLLQSLSLSVTKIGAMEYDANDAVAAESGESKKFSTINHLLIRVFSCLIDSLSSALWSESEDCEFLSAAKRYAKQLQAVLASEEISEGILEGMELSDGTGNEREKSQEFDKAEIADEDFNVSGVGSLTLSLDEDFLQLPEASDEGRAVGVPAGIGHFSQSTDLLDSLAQLVAQALTPSSDQRLQLPSLAMLKALYLLTELAQSVNASQVLALAQPLQRAALALHREGHQFNASQTRFIGKLVHAMQVRVQMFDSDRLIDAATTSVEAQLPEFVDAIRRKTQVAKEEPEALLELGTNELTLDEVFAREAIEIVERINNLLADKAFDQEILNEALACVHTLKGSARMAGKTAIHESAHLLESSVQAVRAIQDKKEALDEGCRRIREALLHAPSQSRHQSSINLLMDDMLGDTKHQSLTNKRGSESLGLTSELGAAQFQLASELSKLDALGHDINHATKRLRETIGRRMVISTASLTPILDDLQLSNSELRQLLDLSRSAHRQTMQTAARMQQSVLRDSLVGLDQMHGRLGAIVDDAAQASGVVARVNITCQDVLIDQIVFSKLSTILEHLLRNAVVHGIEKPEERFSINKPERGTISLSFSVDEADLVVKLSDDGRGVSVNAINQLLHKRGETPVNDIDGLYSLLFQPGFSSVGHATSIAGRGLGLFAVKNLVDQLDGEIAFENVDAPGLSVIIRFPSGTIANRIVLVQDDGCLYGLPAKNIVSVSKGDDAADVRCDSDSGLISLPRNVLFANLLGEHGHSLNVNPFDDTPRSKATAFSKSVSRSIENSRTTTLTSAHDPAKSSLKSPLGSTSKTSVIVDVEGKMITTTVDRVIGYRVLIVEPVGEQIYDPQRFSAIGNLESGEQVLIIDFGEALRQLDTKENPAAGSSSDSTVTRTAPVVMLIDDSPVNRLRLQKLMLARGLAVQLSCNALHALECIKTQKPDLIVMDLDIPAFSAKSFKGALIKTYGETAPPFIATSRQSEASARLAATELGAAALISKPCSEAQLYRAFELAGLSVADLNIG